VPDILLSGDHARVDQWRHRQSLLRTRDRRPDLLEKAALLPEDQDFLEQHPTE
jgi:tRNA (guanine37-N1)-methyltransferase